MINKFNYFALTFCLILLNGCGINPLALTGVINFGMENYIIQQQLSPAKDLSIAHSIAPEEYIVTIDKIQISPTGAGWTTIHDKSQEVRVEGSNSSLVGVGKPTTSEQYEGVRVWFGKKIKVKYKKYDNTEVLEERDDMDKGNPYEFTTANFKLDYPFTVDKGHETRVIFRFNFQGSISGDQFQTLPSITVRVTKFLQ